MIQKASAFVLPVPSLVTNAFSGVTLFEFDPLSAFYISPKHKKTLLGLHIAKPFYRFPPNVIGLVLSKTYAHFSLAYRLNINESDFADTYQNTCSFIINGKNYKTGLDLGFQYTDIQAYSPHASYVIRGLGQFKIDKNWSSQIVISSGRHRLNHENKHALSSALGIQYQVSEGIYLTISHELNAYSEQALSIGFIYQNENGYEFLSGFSYARQSLGFGIRKTLDRYSIGTALNYHSVLGSGHAIEGVYAF